MSREAWPTCGWPTTALYGGCARAPPNPTGGKPCSPALLRHASGALPANRAPRAVLGADGAKDGHGLTPLEAAAGRGCKSRQDLALPCESLCELGCRPCSKTQHLLYGLIAVVLMAIGT